MVPDHPSQARERPEPYEKARAIPSWLAVLAVALALWGVVYLFRYAGNDWGEYGDRRSLAALAPPAAAQASSAADGKTLYATHCSACHQATGSGVPGAFPPLAGSELVARDPETLVRIILLGVSGKLTVGDAVYAGQMPSLAALSDAEIAAIGSYERASFGNSAPPFAATLVAKVRRKLGERTEPVAGDAELRKR